MPNERWLLTAPAMKLPQSFYNENVARRQAERIEAATGTKVTITHQVLKAGEWVERRVA